MDTWMSLFCLLEKLRNEIYLFFRLKLFVKEPILCDSLEVHMNVGLVYID